MQTNIWTWHFQSTLEKTYLSRVICPAMLHCDICFHISGSLASTTASYMVCLFAFIYCVWVYVVYGQGHTPRQPVAVREPPMGVLLPSLPCGSWTLNSAILAGLLFSKLGKKKNDPQNTEIFNCKWAILSQNLNCGLIILLFWFVNLFIKFLCQVWWFMPVIPALGR